MYADAPPEIYAVEANVTGGVATIYGRQFGLTTGRVLLEGSRGSVYAQLIVATWTNEQVVVFLPPGLEAGTYFLRIVCRNKGGGDSGEATDGTLVVGTQGPPGPRGDRGDTGAAGAQGAQGPPGPQGAPGPAGPTGAPGPAGPQGPMGPGGPMGPQGLQGLTGAPGPGYQWKGPWDPQATYVSGDTVQLDGTSYVATVTTTGNMPPAAPWQLFAAAGRDGLDGAQGLQGLPGPTGPAGSIGPTGQTGPGGPTGSVGPMGPMGSQGVQGVQGQPGPAATVATASVPLVALTLNSTAPQIIPQTITLSVPSGTSVSALVEAEGELQLNGSAGTFGLVELHLLVDGVTLPPARALRTSVVNVGAGNLSNAWRLHALIPLTPGQHDFKIEGVVLASSGSSVSVGANWVNQGRLSVVLLRQ